MFDFTEDTQGISFSSMSYEDMLAVAIFFHMLECLRAAVALEEGLSLSDEFIEERLSNISKEVS